MITNAKDRSVNSPGVLDMSGALLNLFKPIRVFIVTQTVENFQAVETLAPYNFQGVLQPMKERSIMMKPEGQRSWRWQTLHAMVGLDLKIGSYIWINNTKYRIMSVWEWSDYGFVEYHLTQDYQDRGTSPPIPDSALESFVGSVVYTTDPVEVDVSATISDAQKTIWKLYDSAGAPVLAAITVIDAETVEVSGVVAGTYKLVGKA